MNRIDMLTCGAVLAAEGSVLRTTSDALLHQAALRPEDFTDPKARVVWGLFLKLQERRRPCTIDSVFTFGRHARVFAEKDIAWLREWESEAITITREAFGDLVDGLRRTSRAKALAEAFESAVAQLRAPSPDVVAIVEKLTDLQRDAISAMVDETSTGDMDLAALADRWERVEAGQEQTDIISTGCAVLDALIGGFYPNLNVIIGAPSEGKSAFIASCIEALLLLGFTVGVVGLEDGTEWIQRRHVAKGMGINARDVGRKPRDYAQQKKFADVTEYLAPLVRRLKTFKRGGITTSKLLQICAKWRSEGVDVIFVDHGGELDHSSDKVDEHRLRVGLSFKRMRDFATTTGTKMVVVAHTRRRNDNDTEPRPPRADEVRDASDIENAARLVLGVWQVPGEDCIRVTSAKVTEGERYKTVKLPKVAGGVLVDLESAEVVDLFAERMAAAKARKEARDQERREARERAEREKATAKEARAKAKSQSTLFNGNEGP